MSPVPRICAAVGPVVPVERAGWAPSLLHRSDVTKDRSERL